MDTSKFDHMNKRILLGTALICFVLLYNNIMAQRRPVQLDSELKQMMDQADLCVRNKEGGCDELFHAVILKGKGMKDMDDLDYLYYKLGLYFYRIGMQDSAIYNLRVAKDIASQQRDTASLADIFNVMGTAHYEIGKIDTAIFYFIESSRKLEQLGDSIYLAYTFANIGLTLGEVLNNEESLKYLLRAHEILEQLNAGEFTSVVMANIALAYFHVADNSSAIEWSRKTLDFLGDNNQNESGVITYYTLALATVDNKEASTGFAEKSVSIALENDIRSRIAADAMDVYVGTLIANASYTEALQIAQRSISIHRELENPLGLSRSLRYGAQAALKSGAFQTSALYWEEHAYLSDTLLSESGRKIINELSVQYETEKKEKEIAQGQVEIARQQGRIRMILFIFLGLFIIGLTLWWSWLRNQKLKLASLQKEKEIDVLKAWMLGEEQERNRISKELHDGVASMISAALANLRVLSKLPDDKLEIQHAKLEGILEKTHLETRRIAHNLLPLTLENEGLIAAVEEFVHIAQAIGGTQVSIRMDIQSKLLLDKPAQLVVYRIIQELVQNALKHSNASEIKVDLLQIHNDLKVMVRDNGTGLNSQDGSGNQGFQTIKDRLEAMGADMKMDENAEAGLSVELLIHDAF